MAKLDKLDVRPPANSARLEGSYWENQLETFHAKSPIQSNTINEHEIWKNALLVGTLMKNHSK